MTDKKPTRAPMAAAIRTFVAGMKFPPAPDHGANPNIELAEFTVVMLQFARGVTEDCDSIAVSPAVSQIMEVIHGSERSVNRRLKALRGIGLMTQRERGHLSAEYTFHQTPATPTDDVAAATPTDGTARKSQRRQVPRPATPTNRPATPTPAPATPTVVALWGKSSGSSLENKPLGSGGEPRSGSISRDDFELKNGRMIRKGGVR